MADTLFSHDMGDNSYDSYTSADAPQRSSLAVMTNVLGAVVSLGLIGGVGVWGYKLLMRDVSGIPVVRAAEGDMRVLPKDPGGQLAQHTGLAVNRVAAEGGAAKPADRLVLAPDDVSLAAEDQPIVREAAPVTQPEALAPAEDIAAPASLTAEMDSDALQAATINEIVGQLTSGTGPINTSTAARVVQAKVVPAVTRDTPRILPAETPGVPQSKRPQLRPASAPAVVVPAAMIVPTQTAEIDPAAIPAGTRLAQLGAFDSVEVARAEWGRLQGTFGDYLDGKSRVIQKAQSGGRTFYRLRAMGFTDLSDARRFCSALVAEKADCIPVVSK